MEDGVVVAVELDDVDDMCLTLLLELSRCASAEKESEGERDRADRRSRHTDR